MEFLSNPHVRLDLWLLAGAALQCAVILRARRFQAHHWIMPLTLLIGGSFGWFGFLTICSTVPDAANGFIIGFFMAITFAATFVAEAAPPRLGAAALLSLTLTFWVVYWEGGVGRDWALAALPMTMLTLRFAWNPATAGTSLRCALQTWSLAAAAVIASDGVPARVSAVLKDYRVAELAHLLGPVELMITGAQFFLFILMVVGLILLIDAETWRAWLPSSRDERPRWTLFAVLLGQGALLVWARRQNPEIQNRFFSLSVMAALAHGAMSGEDALQPQVDSALEFHMDERDRVFLANVRRSAWSFLARRWALLLAFAAVMGWAAWRVF